MPARPKAFNQKQPYNGWEWEEWQEFQKQLNDLELEQLVAIAKETGITFSAEFSVTKQELIDVLVEVPKKVLIVLVNKHKEISDV